MKKNNVKKADKYGVIHGSDISLETIGIEKDIQIGEYSNEELTISQNTNSDITSTQVLEIKKPQIKKSIYKKWSKIIIFFLSFFIIVILIILAASKII